MQIVFLSLHSLHDLHGGQHIVHSPVGVDNLTGKTVDLNGITQLVGVAMPIFVDRQQVQLVFAL